MKYLIGRVTDRSFNVKYIWNTSFITVLQFYLILERITVTVWFLDIENNVSLWNLWVVGNTDANKWTDALLEY